MRFPLLFKVLALGLLVLMLSAVLMRIGYLVDERQARQGEAQRSVEQSHAGAQTLIGPWVEQRCVEEWDVVSGEGKDRKLSVERREPTLRRVPDQLVVGAQVRSELRTRGLYRIPTYGGPVNIDAAWNAPFAQQPRRERSDSRWACEAPRLVLAISDVRGLRAATLALDEQPAAVRAGTLSAAYPQGVHADLPANRPATAALKARWQLQLAGTGQLALVPAAEATEWKLSSDWAHPSFGGRFLPERRSVSAGGFEAAWQVSSLATGAPDQLQRGVPLCGGAMGVEGDAYSPPGARAAGCLDTLSVAFFDPVNPYVLSDRAIKYGLLFVVLTFAAVLLVEALSGRRVHPIQYALVGLGLSLFFLLLLSLSEHLPFAQAYGAAATACALLLGYYGGHMLGRWRAGLAFGAGIGLLYGLLYLLLQMEQNALVVGSLALFVVLAAVMVLTRRVDWYTLFDSWRRSAAVAAPVGR